MPVHPVPIFPLPDDNGRTEKHEMEVEKELDSSTSTIAVNVYDHEATGGDTSTSCKSTEMSSASASSRSEESVEKACVLSLFDDTDKVHNHDACKDNCRSLSSAELQRIAGQKDKFQHDWLNDKELAYCKVTGMWWLCYVEGQGMFCALCRKHNCINEQNKCSSFGDKPSIRMKKSAVTDHLSSKKHNGAKETEMLNRVSFFQKELTEREKVGDDVLYKVFYAMYWLAKEGIANVKIITLLNLIEKLGISEIKHFQHRSRSSLREMLTTEGDEVENSLLVSIRNADFFSILLDDSSDVSTMEQMICYVQYWDGLCCQVKFLFIANVLENAESANAETLYKLVKQKLVELGLDSDKLSGVSTDGASVMVGKREGLVTKLKRDNPSLLAIHCICHRLALACVDTNSDLSYMKEVEGHVTHVWKLFHYSPVKLAALLKAQTEVHKMNLSGQTTKFLTRTMKRACQTRWLSFDNAIQSLFQELLAVVQTLNKFSNEATAYGLMKKITSLKFIGTIYILQKVLPILAGLSQHFQKGNVNFSMIAPALDSTKTNLKSLSEEEIFSSLLHDLSTDGRLSTLNVDVSEFTLDLLKRNLRKYIEALCTNIDERFEQSPLFAAFSVFDPRCLPERESEEFSSYGTASISTLADHFFQENDVKEQALAEWHNLKFNLVSWKREIPNDIVNGESDVTPMEWLLKKLLILKGSMKHFFPHLIQVAEIIFTLPVSNAWPERGFSKLKLVKTGLRNRMQNDILQSLLQISLNGPKLFQEQTDNVIKNSVKRWLSAKKRRKLPKSNVSAAIGTSHNETVGQSVTETATQTDFAAVEIDIDRVELEYQKAVRVLQLSKYAQKIAACQNPESEDDLEESDDEGMMSIC